MPTQAPRSIAVIDGNSLMHRAFHSIPKNMASSDGTPTNAAFGFLSMLFKFIEDFKPDGVICAFDKGAPQFRIELLEQYKEHRPPTDPDLKTQFPVIRELLASLEIPCVMAEGWEGDDILGTLSARGEEEGYRMYLVTGDKDAYQLASDLTRIVTTRKGITDVVVYGPAEVEERYGITPDIVTDFYGLKGDTSDNIPGVPGIGEKTASKLLQQYGTLENLLDHADEIKGKMGENLRNHKEDACISKQIATISREAPVELELEQSKFPTYDPEAIREIFNRYGFNSHLRRAISFLDTSTGSELDEAASNALALSKPQRGDAAISLIDAVLKSGEKVGVFLDDGKDEGALFGLGDTLYIATEKGIAAVEESITETLIRLFAEGSVSSLDLKYLIEVLAPSDLGEKQTLDPLKIPMTSHTDLRVAAYLLDSSRSTYELDMLLEKFLGIATPEATEEISLGAIQAAAARSLSHELEHELEKTDSISCYKDIELPLIPVLTVMERNGMLLDTDILTKQSRSMDDDIERLTSEIHEIAGEEFNIGSPQQLSRILFEVLELPPKKKTRTGFSTDASVLEELSALSPLPEKIIQYRELTKLKSTYLDALPRMVEDKKDGRVHTTFHQTVAATGRLSSSDPNLQNIPVRTELGRAIREAFTVPEGHMFVSADYSQIELRLLAHLSGDEGLIDAFAHGRDFHSATASAVFGVDAESITPDLRSRAKAVNFGIVYGQQAYGLSQSLKIPFDEAAAMIDRYFNVYPGVREYLDEIVDQARKTGYAVTMFGRRRPIHEINSRNPNLRGFGERTAMNHPLQGSAADIIKLAMIQVQERLSKLDLEARMVLQVHDELDFEVPEAEVDQVEQLVVEVMSEVVDLKVPLSVTVSSGKNWAVAH